MNAIKKQTSSGFRSLADLRPLVFALAQLREAAGLGLPLPPPSDDARSVQARRKGAVTGDA